MHRVFRCAFTLLIIASAIGIHFDCTNSALAEAPPPSADALVQVIEKASIFPASQKVQARVNGVVALVSTYKDKSSKDAGNDCKINAVLVAREVFNKFPDLARVKVKFYDPLKLTSSDTVSVTVGDVTAFSSGQTSTAKLLASLELHHEQESTAPQNLKPSTPLRVASGSAHSSSSSIYSSGSHSKYMPISAAGTTNDLVGYIQRDLNMKLSYPKGWILAEKPDPSALFNLTTTQDDQGVLVQMYANPRIPGASLENFARLTFDTYLRPTKGCRLTATRAVRFGKDGSIEGICQEISMPFNNMPAKAAFYYFVDGDKTVLLECIAGETLFSKIEPSFNSILLSIVPGSVRSASTGAHRSQSTALPASAASSSQTTRDGYAQYRVPGIDVSFKYPASWKMHAPSDANALVKMAGMGPQNKYGEMSLSSADFPQPSLLEMHANAVEEEWLHNLKDGRKLSRAHISANGSDILRDSLVSNQNGQITVIQLAHFCHEGKLFSLVMVGPGWPSTEAQVYFDKVLSSVRAR